MGEYTKLSKPETTTYAIIWEPRRSEVKGYTEIQSTQSLHTKWEEIDYYTDRNEWKSVLASNGINIEDE